MKLSNLDSGRYAAKIQTAFAETCERAAVEAFDKHCGTAGAAMQVPASVETAVTDAAKSFRAALNHAEAQYVKNANVSVIGSGNVTHPVCSVEVAVRFASL